METIKFNGYVLDFYKNAVKASFDAASTFTAQSAVLTDKLLGTVPSFPEEGKKIAGIYFDETQKGLAILRKYVESNLELDWTAQDAPVKSLEAMETLSKEAFKEAAEIQKEIKPLVEKATAQLPKEAKELVGFSNDLVTSGSESLKNNVIKNFEAAKKTVGEASAAGKKAAK